MAASFARLSFAGVEAAKYEYRNLIMKRVFEGKTKQVLLESHTTLDTMPIRNDALPDNEQFGAQLLPEATQRSRPPAPIRSACSNSLPQPSSPPGANSLPSTAAAQP